MSSLFGSVAVWSGQDHSCNVPVFCYVVQSRRCFTVDRLLYRRFDSYIQTCVWQADNVVPPCLGIPCASDQTDTFLTLGRLVACPKGKWVDIPARIMLIVYIFCSVLLTVDSVAAFLVFVSLTASHWRWRFWNWDEQSALFWTTSCTDRVCFCILCDN